MAPMAHVQKIIDGLLNPDAYPERPDEVIFVQTSISAVFIAGDLVYKVKKPVNLGYLDFTTKEKRKFYCEEEVRLNRRLCPEIYIGVVPVMEDRGSINLREKGDIIDYAVLMKRLPEEGMMDVMLDEGRVKDEDVAGIADILVPFYRNSRTGEGIDEFGEISSFSINTDENFAQTKRFIGITITEGEYEEIKRYTDRFFLENRDLFEDRIAASNIREGHGDLHSRNICITPKKIFIYDCIEFNERFRIGDVAEDIAFLAMDIDFHLFPALSRHFVGEYVRLSTDESLLKILNFYKCYTAFVRGKVLGFMLEEDEESEDEKDRAKSEARLYFNLARHYAVSDEKPFLIITSGLSGTGKSRISKLFAPEIDLEVIGSDLVRKELSGIGATEHRYARFGEGIYSAGMTKKTYEEITRRARDLLLQKKSVLLDASYLRPEERGLARLISEETPCRFYVLEISCPEEVVKRRIIDRINEGTVSDATIDIYEEQKRFFSPPTEFDDETVIKIDTTRPASENLKDILGRILLGKRPSR